MKYYASLSSLSRNICYLICTPQRPPKSRWSFICDYTYSTIIAWIQNTTRVKRKRRGSRKPRNIFASRLSRTPAIRPAALRRVQSRLWNYLIPINRIEKPWGGEGWTSLRWKRRFVIDMNEMRRGVLAIEIYTGIYTPPGAANGIHTYICIPMAIYNSNRETETEKGRGRERERNSRAGVAS